jgi:peptide deformylase
MILPILSYPDKRLRIVAENVKNVDDTIKKLVSDMFETMYDSNGIGLAATQVNHHIRVIVIDISQDKSQPLCLINPEIIEKSGEISLEEGCLSVPDYKHFINRNDHIKIQALNEKGKTFKIEANDLLSVCIQHEMDHLNGILFVDYLSRIKQQRLLKKIS